MKKKVNVRIQKREGVEIEIDFPLYRRIDYTDRSTFEKLISESEAITITVYEDEDRFELISERPVFIGDENYLLGKGRYSSNKQEFEEALNEVKNFITYHDDECKN